MRSFIIGLIYFVVYSTAQRRLSESEMKNEINLAKFNYRAGKSHECSYLEITKDAYSPGGSSGTDKFYIECCPWKEFPVCGNGRAQYTYHCCPGFASFTDIDKTTKCNERILADRTANRSLAEFRSSNQRIDQFVGSVVRSKAANDLLDTNTWTIFAVANDGFDQSMVDESTNEMLKHLVKGRMYMNDMTNEQTIDSMYLYEANKPYPLKVSRYSNGIVCIECAAVVEANHEFANGVMHIVRKGILTKSQPQLIGNVLQNKYPTFWSMLSANHKAMLMDTTCKCQYTVFVPKNTRKLDSVQSTQRSLAAMNHVIKGLWCTAGMIDAATQPMATMAAGSIKFNCDSQKKRVVTSGSDYSQQSTISSSGGTFDIMAINGVIHEIDEAIVMPQFTTVYQMGEDNQLKPVSEAMKVVKSCNLLKTLPNDAHILVLPSNKALKDFLENPKFSSVPESFDYGWDESVKCKLMSHHIVRTQDMELTDLSRATHLQKIYQTLNSDWMTDFIFMHNNQLQVYFMDALIQNIQGERFDKGRIYSIDKVLIPPVSSIWSRLVTTLPYHNQLMLRHINNHYMDQSNKYTIMLPELEGEMVTSDKQIKMHTIEGVYYPMKYLIADGESLTVTTLANQKLIIRKTGADWLVSMQNKPEISAEFKNCGIKTSVGIGCVISRPLLEFTRV